MATNDSLDHDEGTAPAGPDDVKEVNIQGTSRKPRRISKRSQQLFYGIALVVSFATAIGLYQSFFTTPQRNNVVQIAPPLVKSGQAPSDSTNQDSTLDKIVSNAPKSLDSKKVPPINNGSDAKNDPGQVALSNELDKAAKIDSSGPTTSSNPLDSTTGSQNGVNKSSGSNNSPPANFDTTGPSIPPQNGTTVPNAGPANNNSIPGAQTGVPNTVGSVTQRVVGGELYVGSNNKGQSGEEVQKPTVVADAGQAPVASNLVADTGQTRFGGGGGGNSSTSDAIKFANGQGERPAYLTNTQQQPVGKHELWAGSVIPSLLDTAINTNIPGPVFGHVMSDVYDSKMGQTLLIPKGSRLVGRYNTNVVDGIARIQVSWDRLIWTDGKFISLDGQVGAEPEGQAGLYADLNDHRGRIFTASIFTALISSGAQILANKSGAGGSVSTTSTNNGQVVSQSVGGTIAEDGKTFINKQTNLPNELTVPKGKPFDILLDRTIVLPAWHYE